MISPAMSQREDVVILGAGLSGLSTALHLDPATLVLEREARVGGLARTDAHGPYRFDFTGHWLHLRHPHLKALVGELLGDDLLNVERRSAIFSHGVFTPYPFQSNFAGLPPAVVKECLLGYVEARLRDARGEAGEPQNFADFIQKFFGPGIARHFMIPYNSRLWGVPPEEITAEWCGRFVPRPGLEEVIDGALGTRVHQVGYNAAFVYPASGGIEALPRALAARLSNVRLNTEVTSIDPLRRVVRHASGEVGYERLVSSLPLPELIRRLDPAPVGAKGPAPQGLMEHASRLRATHLRYLNVAVRGRGLLRGNHWVYVPEERWPFYRLGCYSNAVPGMAPPDASTFYVELSNLLGPEWTDARILAALVEFFKDIGDIRGPEDLLFWEFRRIPCAYVIFDHAYFAATAALHAALEPLGILSIGRYGRWVYNAMEDALQDGVEAAARLRSP
jgi:protoporphyrinogen oxidase